MSNPNQKRVFGSGKARVGDVGAVLTDANNGVGDVQGASLDIKFQKKELFNSREISMFAVGFKYFGGSVEIKLNWENLNRDVLARSCGATSATAGGQVTLTITGNSTPGSYRIELELQDENGQPVLIVLPNASAPGLSLALALDDYGKSDMVITGYPDANNVVCTITGAQ